MGFGWESKCYVECDVCHESDLSSAETLKVFLLRRRKIGWIVGKCTLCPACAKAKKRVK